ncbi:hypothetical protein [Marinoscillum sp.]|uniref:hypothetical protein n=1 Tax=Marinoscillum sp. TaxID=2024838 RepID=UPI003BAB98DB
MISKAYIQAFKRTEPFEIIKTAVKNNQIKELLIGHRPYSLTSKYDLEDTVPSQILIGLHILADEDDQIINLNLPFQEIEITVKNVCLILGYLVSYRKYRESHAALLIDVGSILSRVIERKSQYDHLSCFNKLISKV